MLLPPKKCYYPERQNFTWHRLFLGVAPYKTMTFFFLEEAPKFYLAPDAVFVRSSEQAEQLNPVRNYWIFDLKNACTSSLLITMNIQRTSENKNVHNRGK